MNIERLLAFDTDGHRENGSRVEIGSLQASTGGALRGTNDYLSLVPNPALLAHADFHRRSVDAFEGDELTIMLGLEPVLLTALPTGASAKAKATQALADAKGLTEVARRIGETLAEAQGYATGRDKRLRFVLRIASEMNAGTGNVWAGAPLAFQQAYNQIAAGIKAGANQDPANPARLLFSFSPGIQRNVDVAGLTAYWPGETHVDLIGCTWYTRLFASDSDQDPEGTRSFDKLKAYFLEFLDSGLDYCIDELGCCESTGSSADDNAGVYRQALQRLGALAMGGMALAHATLFTVGDWKADVATIVQP